MAEMVCEYLKRYSVACKTIVFPCCSVALCFRSDRFPPRTSRLERGSERARDKREHHACF